MNERLWMSKAEAATALGVGARQVKRYMDDGYLEWEREKISGRIRISRASVLKMQQDKGRRVVMRGASR